jgi:hypothetical protein
VKNKGDYVSITTSENDKINLVTIYDVLGRKIMDQYSNEKEIRISRNTFHQKGLYILKIQLENSQVFIKKIIP